MTTDRGQWFYLEDSQTTRNGNIVETIEVIHWRANQYPGTESSVVRKQYDCQAEKVRQLEMQSFTGEFGTGEITSSGEDLDSPWSDVGDTSINKSFMVYACNDEDYFKGLWMDEYVPSCEETQKSNPINASIQLELISELCSCIGEYTFDALGQYTVREIELGIRDLSITREISESLAPNYCLNRVNIK